MIYDYEIISNKTFLHLDDIGENTLQQTGSKNTPAGNT